MVRQQLSQDFSEMRSVSSENLLYIKEDLIIPHVRHVAAWRQTLSPVLLSMTSSVLTDSNKGWGKLTVGVVI